MGFLIFMLMYFGLYGGLNAYVLLKFRFAFPAHQRWQLAFAFFLVVMVVGPILTRMVERHGYYRTSGVLAALVFTWMAIAFWVLAFGLPMDAWNLALRLGARLRGWENSLRIPAKAQLVVLAAILALACIWGPVEAGRIRLKTVRLTTPRLPPGSPPVRRVQLVDMHLGQLPGEGRLRTALRLVREAEPDILVAVGDIIDSQAPEADYLAQVLAEAEAPLGKFAVLGNHEFYVGLKRSIEFHRAAGFQVLREEAAEVGGIVLAGVDFSSERGGPSASNEDKALPAAGDERAFTVLLKHKPKVDPGSLGRFDLQLSGHTHGGQIFPFQWIVHLFYPLGFGLRPLGADAAVYVSRGAGTWGPPMRLLAPPEVTLFIVSPEELP